MAYNTIQFKGKDQVLKAYQNRSADGWAIFQARQFMFKGVGSEELESILDMLCNGSTNAIYTLKVFDEIENCKEIKGNTPDDGSFNFKLNSDGQEINNLQYRAVSFKDELQSKILELEKEIELLKEEREEDEKPALGGIGQILEHPSVAPLLPVIIEKILSFLSPKKDEGKLIAMPENKPAAIGSVSNLELSDVVNELKKYDPNLLQHLRKLLELAKNDNATFNVIVKSFD